MSVPHAQFLFFLSQNFPSCLLALLQATETTWCCSAGLLTPAYFQLVPSTSLPNATITEGRSYSLIWGFLFHSTSILTGSAETMQVGPTWPVSVSSPSKSALFSSVVQGSVLSTSLHCNFLDLLVFSSGDVAELCSEVTQVMQRAERKAAVTPFIKTVHHSLPSIESK